jgi:hypothetical protein
MSALPPHDRAPLPPEPSTLTDRVLARVSDAALAVDRRADAARHRTPRTPAPLDPRSAQVTRSPAQIREARSLRRVFDDLGHAYRQYRRRTGAPVSPEVRAAAYRFRRELNVASLVSVAARLDELRAMRW